MTSAGIFLVFVGIWIWLSNLGYLNFRRDWPLLLVLLGVYLIIENIVNRFKSKSDKKVKNVLESLEKGEVTVEGAERKIGEE